MTSKIDSRKLPDKLREEIRRDIVRLRSQGDTNRTAANSVGISERHANLIWQSYCHNENLPLFVWERRGRRKGEQRSITYAQELSLLAMLLNEPSKMKFRAALWTRQLFQQAIKRRVNIDVPIRTAGEYLKRWGLILQKPLGVTKNTNSQGAQDWLRGDYKYFVERAKVDGGEIHWLVEKSIGGHTAKIYDDLLCVKKKKVARLIASITNKGQIRFMLHKSELTGLVLIEFLSRLIEDAGRKVFLLAQHIQAGDHGCIEEWLTANKSSIELIYLPVDAAIRPSPPSEYIPSHTSSGKPCPTHTV